MIDTGPLGLFQDALDSAGLPFDAGLMDRVDPAWHVVARPDGLLVRLDPRAGFAVTAAQYDAADALVLGLALTAPEAMTDAEVADAVASLTPAERDALSQRMLADWARANRPAVEAAGVKLRKKGKVKP